MQSNAKFESLVKIPSTSRVVRGVKNCQIPANAVAGGNGSFVVAKRAELILRVICEDGRFIDQDIYLDVKDYTERRITEKFCGQLEDMFSDFDFVVEKGKIINLDEVLSNLD